MGKLKPLDTYAGWGRPDPVEYNSIAHITTDVHLWYNTANTHTAVIEHKPTGLFLHFFDYYKAKLFAKIIVTAKTKKEINKELNEFLHDIKKITKKSNKALYAHLLGIARGNI